MFLVKYGQLKRFNEDFKDHVYASFRCLGAWPKVRCLAFFFRDEKGEDHLTCEMRGDLRVRNEMF